MNSYTWPDGTPKSQQNAFTAHLDRPHTAFTRAFRGALRKRPTDLKKFAVYSKATPKEL